MGRRKLRLLALLAASVVGAMAAVAVASSSSPGTPPPGATALCRDATFSFSKTHSGTCSHHGGVARWLDGGTARTSGKGPPASPSAVDLGRTVLLAKRTQTAGCTLAPNPDRDCSP